MVTTMLEKAIEIEGLLRVIRDGNPLPETYKLLTSKTAELAECAMLLELETRDQTNKEESAPHIDFHSLMDAETATGVSNIFPDKHEVTAESAGTKIPEIATVGKSENEESEESKCETENPLENEGPEIPEEQSKVSYENVDSEEEPECSLEKEESEDCESEDISHNEETDELEEEPDDFAEDSEELEAEHHDTEDMHFEAEETIEKPEPKVNPIDSFITNVQFEIEDDDEILFNLDEEEESEQTEAYEGSVSTVKSAESVAPTPKDKLADEKPAISPKRETKIKSAFSLNDRFLYSRELFDGNMKMFDSTLEFIEGIDEYPIIEDYFYSELEWDPENRHVATFMDILRPFFKE